MQAILHGSYLAPVLPQGVICSPQVVPGDLRGHVMRHMHTDVMCQELYPAINSQGCQQLDSGIHGKETQLLSCMTSRMMANMIERSRLHPSLRSTSTLCSLTRVVEYCYLCSLQIIMDISISQRKADLKMSLPLHCIAQGSAHEA